MFRSLKTVPTATGCVAESSAPVGQIVFNSLEALLNYGWKAARFDITISGSFKITLKTSPFTSITYVDYGGGLAEATNGAAPMSDFVCQPRLASQHVAPGLFTDTSIPGEIFDLPLTLNTAYGTAHRNGSQFWFANWSYGSSEITTDPTTNRDVGALFIDGAEVSRLYYTNNFEADYNFTLLAPYTVTVTTVASNSNN